MKLTLSWLKDYLDTSADLFTITEALTQLGLEVESVHNPGANLRDFVVAEIREAVQHPEADRLRVCKVAAAQGELQIVCGAPNARAGIKVALANIGTVIPTNGMEIKKSKIRGVESQGMLCSARELGIGTEDSGIMELNAEAKIGASIVELLGLNDPLIDLSITANRGDCVSIYGIARELAAKGIGTLKPLPAPKIVNKGKSDIAVRIDAPQDCPVFFGRRIRGVTNGASPAWLVQRLQSVGQKSISALVDITNYFTLAYGRPLHVYDAAKLKGGIVVRRAKSGETFAALNEKSYTLDDSMCAIADDSGAIGLGGIMGGASTGVDEATNDVFLECALFQPALIWQTGRKLAIESDARHRFERGVDAAFMPHAVELATQMILELCGGEASEIVQTGTVPDNRNRVAFDPAFVNQLGGTNLSRARMEQHLKALGFELHGNEAQSPSYRHDIALPADLAEEILRLEGYDNIAPVSLPKPEAMPPRALGAMQARIAQTRTALAARGLHETHSWAFFAEQDAEQFGAQHADLHLRNPISSELSVMRTSLLPHLLRAAAKNQARGFADVHLFEIGASYSAELPQFQEPVAAILRVGDTAPLHWQGGKQADLFAVKADMEALLGVCGMDATKLTLDAGKAPAYLHGARAAALMLGPKNMLGAVGELHPALAETYGITGRAVVCELYLERIPLPKPAKRRALTVSDFQAATRDFAFVVDGTYPAGELLARIRNAGKPLLKSVTLFDVYEGKNLEAGKKSLAFRALIQADDRTLTDAEIDGVAQAIINAAHAVGAMLR
jgi:phenylalanyl-tRNA synthetase beta chain